jgi:hypothetical protein
VLADDVDDRRPGAAGVVEVGDAVGQAGTEVQQRHGRGATHSRVPVGGAGHDALGQPEDGADAGNVVEGLHQRHLGGPGVGEAHVDPGGFGRGQQAHCTLHALLPRRCRVVLPCWRATVGAGKVVVHVGEARPAWGSMVAFPAQAINQATEPSATGSQS